MATVTIPSLRLLPTASHATRALKDAKRRSRKHALRLANLANSCLLFAFLVSPRRRKHPYLIWVCLSSTLGSFGVDFWFNRDKGVAGWACSLIEDLDVPFLTLKRKTPATSPKKDEDLVVVEAEADVNGEIVQRDMEKERKLQRTRAWFSCAALGMAIVGLWGDGA
jgi:autophagy-related protein 33